MSLDSLRVDRRKKEAVEKTCPYKAEVFKPGNESMAV